MSASIKTRLVTASALLVLVFLGFVLEPFRFVPFLLILVLGVISVWELGQMVRPHRILISQRLAMLAVAIMIYAAWRDTLTGGLLVMGMTSVLALIARMMRDPIEGAWRDVAATLGAVAYVGIPLACTMELFQHTAETRTWLMFMLLVIWGTDSFALFIGRRFGRTKMNPRLSPRKTWEGAFGGLIGALVPGLIFRIVSPAPFEHVGDIELVLVALMLSVGSQLGDLAESLVKRDSGVKDSGDLLPGHGGALDRLDSILMTAVPFTIYLRFFQPQLFS